jgi:phage-related protein
MTATDDQETAPKRVRWVGSSRRDLRAFPKGVRSVFGQALFDARLGGKHPAAKPLEGLVGPEYWKLSKTRRVARTGPCIR